VVITPYQVMGGPSCLGAASPGPATPFPIHHPLLPPSRAARGLTLTPQASFPAGSTRDFSAISQGMAQWASHETSLLLFSESVCEPNLGSGSGPEPLPVDVLLIDVTRRALAGRRGPPSRLLLLLVPPSWWRWSVSLVCILFRAPCLSVWNHKQSTPRSDPACRLLQDKSVARRAQPLFAVVPQTLVTLGLHCSGPG
jgi:hypothetical protein